MTVAIIGLGLMGGSLAMAIRKLPMIKSIVGFDHNKEHEKEAFALKLVDKIVSFDELKKADIIILAIPVDAIIACLKELEGVSEKTTIIDLGSTKEKIIRSVSASLRKNFVAAHPMTGTEKFGPGAALEDLYHDKVVVLCDMRPPFVFSLRFICALSICMRMSMTCMSPLFRICPTLSPTPWPMPCCIMKRMRTS
jgi:prephenate dehydrogenase